MAMTAWSANVRRISISLSENGPAARRATAISRSRPAAEHRHLEEAPVAHPPRAVARLRRAVGIGLDIRRRGSPLGPGARAPRTTGRRPAARTARPAGGEAFLRDVGVGHEMELTRPGPGRRRSIGHRRAARTAAMVSNTGCVSVGEL